MLTDAHCHPFDLLKYLPGAEEERRRMGIVCAASAWNREQFEYHEGLSPGAASLTGARSETGIPPSGDIPQEGAAPRAGVPPPVIPCFGLHPQLPASLAAGPGMMDVLKEGEQLLEKLAGEGRLGAIGESGFDLYDAKHRNFEEVQERLFRRHLEIARRYDLPLIFHVRRAMHKIFSYTRELKFPPSVIFHSWSGTLEEGEALLRRGVNAFFSFGTVILKNHREAMRCAARLAPERLLLETDAPYQPLRGGAFSSWADLPLIRDAMATLRNEAGRPCASPGEVETAAAANFFRALRLNLASPPI
jgi:TatD DNase family protein